MLQQRLNQIFEALLGSEVASPPAKINSAQDDLAITRSLQRLSLFDDSLQAHRPALSANAGDNAKRAAVVATILHFQVRARSRSKIVTGKNRSGNEFSVGKDFADNGKRRRGESDIFERDEAFKSG